MKGITVSAQGHCLRRRDDRVPESAAYVGGPRKFFDFSNSCVPTEQPPSPSSASLSLFPSHSLPHTLSFLPSSLLPTPLHLSFLPPSPPRAASSLPPAASRHSRLITRAAAGQIRAGIGLSLALRSPVSYRRINPNRRGGGGGGHEGEEAAQGAQALRACAGDARRQVPVGSPSLGSLGLKRALFFLFFYCHLISFSFVCSPLERSGVMNFRGFASGIEGLLCFFLVIC